MNRSIIDIEIHPRDEALRNIGASRSDFSDGLERALTGLANRSRHDLPKPTDILIDLQGKPRRLGEVAVIRITLASKPVERAV